MNIFFDKSSVFFRDFFKQKSKVLYFVLSVSVVFFLLTYNHIVATRSIHETASYIGISFVMPMTWFFVFLFFIFLLVYRIRYKSINAFVYKYRFSIAAIFFILCVLFEISGSSIGMWCACFDETDSDLLFGESRRIRCDEWAVFSPLGFSQYYNDFGYFSDIPRACSTDVFLEYGQAVKNPLAIFRPFFFGYLFLPVAKGMSWFWCGRLIALFLVSFEFGLLIANNDKKLSLVLAFLITYSPAVQWWFAINGLVEMLVYTMLSILVFRKYMLENIVWKKLIQLTVIMICVGGYIFTFYPAWMIPLAYILLALAVWTVHDNYKKCTLKFVDFISLVVFILLLAVFMIYFYSKSKDAIQTLRSTVYPGARFETGGGAVNFLFISSTNIWHSITGEGIWGNVCESSFFIDFFPLCWILPIYNFIKNPKKDFLSVVLFSVNAFLGFYCVIGFSPFVSKLTFLSNCQANRVIDMFGFCNVLLLIRTIAINSLKIKNPLTPFVFSFIITVCTSFACYKVNPSYLSELGKARYFVYILTFLIFFCLNGFLFGFTENKKRIWCVLSVCVVLFGSFLANPIRSGLKSVEKLKVLSMIHSIQDSDKDAKWVVSDVGFPMGNITLLSGAPCINSTNIYPNLTRWHSIDSDKSNERIYNRYAHIQVNIVDASEPKFYEGSSADVFIVELSIDHLKFMGVKYIMSAKDLLPYVLSGDVTYLAKEGAYRFYRINDECNAETPPFTFIKRDGECKLCLVDYTTNEIVSMKENYGN